MLYKPIAGGGGGPLFCSFFCSQARVLVSTWLGFRRSPKLPPEAPVRAAAIHPGASACPPGRAPAAALPGLRGRAGRAALWSLHVGPRPPRPGAHFHFKPPACRSLSHSRHSCPCSPGLRSVTGSGAAELCKNRPEDASGPSAIDNEAAGAATRPGLCAPQPHLPARQSGRLTVLPPLRCSAHSSRRPMAARPRPGPPHSGRAAHGPLGARGALPAV